MEKIDFIERWKIQQFKKMSWKNMDNRQHAIFYDGISA